MFTGMLHFYRLLCIFCKRGMQELFGRTLHAMFQVLIFCHREPLLFALCLQCGTNQSLSLNNNKKCMCWCLDPAVYAVLFVEGALLTDRVN